MGALPATSSFIDMNSKRYNSFPPKVTFHSNHHKAHQKSQSIKMTVQNLSRLDFWLPFTCHKPLYTFSLNTVNHT